MALGSGRGCVSIGGRVACSVCVWGGEGGFRWQVLWLKLPCVQLGLSYSCPISSTVVVQVWFL